MLQVQTSRSYSLHLLAARRPPSSRSLLRLHPQPEDSRSHSSQLRLVLRQLGDHAMQLIDHLKPARNDKRMAKIPLSSQLHHNNSKIQDLYLEIKRSERDLRMFSTEGSHPGPDALEQRKLELRKDISLLKRRIELNCKQLVQQSGRNALTLFDLHTQRHSLNAKLLKLTHKNNAVALKNKQTLQKIKAIEEAIAKYDSSGILEHIRQQDQQQAVFQHKVEELEKAKGRAAKQRSRLQHLYFRKLRDLDYELAGCRAITNKIAQLDGRLDEAISTEALKANLGSRGAPPRKRRVKTEARSEACREYS